jgi:hypothetical protein
MENMTAKIIAERTTKNLNGSINTKEERAIIELQITNLLISKLQRITNAHRANHCSKNPITHNQVLLSFIKDEL